MFESVDARTDLLSIDTVKCYSKGGNPDIMKKKSVAV